MRKKFSIKKITSRNLSTFLVLTFLAGSSQTVSLTWFIEIDSSIDQFTNVWLSNEESAVA
jgi:hypothetical protein